MDYQVRVHYPQFQVLSIRIQVQVQLKLDLSPNPYLSTTTLASAHFFRDLSVLQLVVERNTHYIRNTQWRNFKDHCGDPAQNNVWVYLGTY